MSNPTQEAIERANPKTWVRMLQYLKPHWVLLVCAIVLAAIVNGTDLFGPYITKLLIDGYINQQDPNLNIYVLGILYLCSVLVGAVCQFFQQYILNSMGQKTIHNIRMEVFSHIQHLPFRFFDQTPTGTILTRATNDVEALSELYTGVIVALFKDFLLLIGIVFIMLRMNVQLALVSFSIIPIILVLTIWYNKKAKTNFRYVRSLSGRINAFFAENISGMRLVQIFNRTKEKYLEFYAMNEEYNRASVFGVFLNAVFKPVSEFINNLTIALLIGYCTNNILGGHLEYGVLFMFINYSKKFFGPINDLSDKYGTIQQGTVSAERIFELLDQKENLEDLEIGEDLGRLPNRLAKIEFKHVWFAYNNEDWVLKDISFVVNPGETVAFVGTTGSGKSTIINLLARFYTVQKGEILLNGKNINNYSLQTLRRFFGVVLQDVFLFAGDIKSNIRLNESEISDKVVEEAATYVNAAPFIEKLNNAYNEVVKERGQTLSMGQRQLLSFARAIAFSPCVMVLDEATANIDTENETLIQQSLVTIGKDRTTLIIAHRLSTIKHAHKIIVLHKGQLKEQGNHEELLLQKGIYFKLYELVAQP